MCIAFLSLCPGVEGIICSSDKAEGFPRNVIGPGGGDERCTGLMIPERELREVASARILEASTKSSIVTAWPSWRSK